MSAGTTIEWTDASWPVVRGCSKVSPGCDNCWAIRDAHLHAGNKNPKMQAHFAGLTKIINGRPNWTGTVRIDDSILNWPLRWKTPQRIFVASSGDLFQPSLPWSEVRRVFAVMREAPHHTYQILTKHAERMMEFTIWWTMQHVDRPPANWWFGVSAENQEWFDKRVLFLLRAPVAVRWVSLEPLLGPIDANRVERPDGFLFDALTGAYEKIYAPTYTTWGKLDWGVIGGESGPRARPVNIEWPRSLVEQFKAAGVPVFMKQMGANCVDSLGRMNGAMFNRKGNKPEQWPEWAQVREFPHVQ